MKNKVQIGRWGIIWIITNMICAKIYLNFARVTIETAGTAGWLLTIFASIVSLMFFILIAKLYKPFAGKDLMDLGEYVGGSFGRVAVGLIIISFFIFIISIVLREFGENMKIIGYNISPISFILAFFMAGVVASAYFGLEAMSRLITIGGPIASVVFFIVLISDAKYYEITNIFPILGNGVYSIFGSGILKTSFFAEFFVLFLLIPYIKSHNEFKTIGYYSLALSSIYLVLASLVFSLVFPYPSNTESFLPLYQMARLINIGRFFQRVESIFVFSWVFVAIHYLSIGFYMIVYVFKKTFKLQYYRPIIIPFAIIIFTLSFIPKNLMDSIVLKTHYFNNAAWLVTFILPIFILIIARMIKKGKKAKS